MGAVALRKESVDRNIWVDKTQSAPSIVALRKESVDRNAAWTGVLRDMHVALRKESVDRNVRSYFLGSRVPVSLSARRAWIEI